MKVSPSAVCDIAAASALTGWIVVTGLSQHPNRAFDRFRSLDRSGTLIPNWRFFAPEPAVHDFCILHRHVGAGGEVSRWRETTVLASRRARQAVWFPDRRRDKAVNDLCNEIVTQLAADAEVTLLPCYHLMRDHVASVLRAELGPDAVPRGFQFVVARSAGYDDSLEPDYLFASAYEPFDPEGPVLRDAPDGRRADAVA